MDQKLLEECLKVFFFSPLSSITVDIRSLPISFSTR